MLFFFFQAEDGIRDRDVTGVQTCALPILVVGDEAPLAGVPNLALRAERAPNGKGAELLGYTRAYAAAVTAAQSAAVVLRSEERRVGKGWRCRWAAERGRENG